MKLVWLSGEKASYTRMLSGLKLPVQQELEAQKKQNVGRLGQDAGEDGHHTASTQSCWAYRTRISRSQQ